MVAVKIQKFLGIAPKISSDLLPETAGQVAFNVKLDSGDLIPYKEPIKVASSGMTTTTKTLYGLKNPSDLSEIKYMTWSDYVDITTAAPEDVLDPNEQRFYYTGDGVPKVSNYTLATATGAPYPDTFYELGLPIPTAKPTTSAASFTVATTSHFARDSGNTATITTGSAHGLKEGNVVTVRDFDDDEEAKAFNATNVTVSTVPSTTTFTYYNSGAQVSSTADTDGKVDIAGSTQSRSYVYTWMTPWDEESIASDPADKLYMKEGQVVTVANLPSAKPSGDNYISGIRLYRSVTSASGSFYYRLKTLWWPIATTHIGRSGTTVTVKFAKRHNLIKDDKFKLAVTGTNSGLSIAPGTVLSVTDNYTITFTHGSSGTVAYGADANGTLYMNAAESSDDTPRYWGESNTNFTDDFLVANLDTILGSKDYDKPEATMSGIQLAHNNIMVGFFENQVCFSEPSKPHAWPEKYRLTIESPIVGISAISGYILIMTDNYPYLVSGSDPSTMSVSRMDVEMPCVAKQSVVNMGYGIAYATYGGLAVFSPTSGVDIVTKHLHDWDTWASDLDASTIIGHYYNGNYFGTHSAQSFIFKQDQQTGGYFTTIKEKFDSAWSDPSTNSMYYSKDTTGDIYQWDKSDQPLTAMEWKSKTIRFKEPVNLGACRIIADFGDITDNALAIANYNLTVPTLNATIWSNAQQAGTFNGPTDYQVSSVDQVNYGQFNSMIVNGDGIDLNYQKTSEELLPIVIKIYIGDNKDLIFETTIVSSDIFRLPRGYKSDTFEISLSGPARVRAILVGETPHGLKAV